MLSLLYHNEIQFIILFWKDKCKLMHFSYLTLSFLNILNFIIIKFSHKTYIVLEINSNP